MAENPWHRLPDCGDYVLPDDEADIRRFNDGRRDVHQFRLDLLPEPYFGSPSAPVVLLALNPGVGADAVSVHRRPTFAKLARASMLHELPHHRPFLHLQSPDSTTPGARWWLQRAGPLITQAGFDAVAKGLLCLQFFPYHSKKWGGPRITVPSQGYTFALLRSAMSRGAEVVVMRSCRRWLEAVPELELYERRQSVRSWLNPTLSRANLPDFDRILRALVMGPDR